jgi:predicted metal-dependent phosphoesterase TrpH
MLVDLHLKTSISEDSDVELESALRRASDKGFDGVVVCERLSTSYSERAIHLGAEYNLNVFVGAEIPTDRGILLCFTPKIDDFILGEEWRRVVDLMTPTAREVLELFEQRKGAVIAARPYDDQVPYKMGDNLFSLDGLAGVEVFSGRAKEVQNDFALEAAESMSLPTVGGSDPESHEGPVGYFGTIFEDDLNSQSEFVQALRHGEYWAVRMGD